MPVEDIDRSKVDYSLISNGRRRPKSPPIRPDPRLMNPQPAPTPVLDAICRALIVLVCAVWGLALVLMIAAQTAGMLGR